MPTRIAVLILAKQRHKTHHLSLQCILVSGTWVIITSYEVKVAVLQSVLVLCLRVQQILNPP